MGCNGWPSTATIKDSAWLNVGPKLGWVRTWAVAEWIVRVRAFHVTADTGLAAAEEAGQAELVVPEAKARLETVADPTY